MYSTFVPAVSVAIHWRTECRKTFYRAHVLYEFVNDSEHTVPQCLNV
jgi:hypothetical protein